MSYMNIVKTEMPDQKYFYKIALKVNGKYYGRFTAIEYSQSWMAAKEVTNERPKGKVPKILKGFKHHYIPGFKGFGVFESVEYVLSSYKPEIIMVSVNDYKYAFPYPSTKKVPEVILKVMARSNPRKARYWRDAYYTPCYIFDEIKVIEEVEWEKYEQKQSKKI